MTKARLLEKGDILNNNDLMEWLGGYRSIETFKKDKKKRLEELEKFCKFSIKNKLVVIEEVYCPFYYKDIDGIKEAIEREIEKRQPLNPALVSEEISGTRDFIPYIEYLAQGKKKAAKINDRMGVLKELDSQELEKLGEIVGIFVKNTGKVFIEAGDFNRFIRPEMDKFLEEGWRITTAIVPYRGGIETKEGKTGK